MEVVARLTSHCFTSREISPLSIKQKAKLGPVPIDILSSITNLLLLETRLIVSSPHTLASANHYGNEKDHVSLITLSTQLLHIFHCTIAAYIFNINILFREQSSKCLYNSNKLTNQM
jgi:hypothetical protein